MNTYICGIIRKGNDFISDKEEIVMCDQSQFSLLIDHIDDDRFELKWIKVTKELLTINNISGYIKNNNDLETGKNAI